MKKTCKCENCRRSNGVVEIEQVTIRGHVAFLCLTCASVLSHNEPKFLTLVRNKPAAEANEEMKKVHLMLSSLLVVGILFFVIVAALGVSQQFTSFPGDAVTVDTGKQQAQYVTFYWLNQFK